MDALEPGTLVCVICGELFCLTCGAKFCNDPAPHICEVSLLSEWEESSPPPCFRCILNVVNP
jgi:hypothetical protein